MRGAGKTTVGKLLAPRLGCAFMDLDDAACERLGTATPAEAFAALGEAAWREAECASLQALLASPPGAPRVDRRPSLVLAIGGGALTHPATKELLLHTKSSLWVAWLHAPVSCLSARIASDATRRPSLLGGDVLQELPTLAQRREADYRTVADYAADASGSAADVSGDLLVALSRRSGESGS